MNRTVFVFVVYQGQYSEEVTMNVTFLDVWFWEEKYGELLTLKCTLFVVRVWVV
jgi:hypothetical protein